MHSKKSVHSSENPQNPSSMLAGHKITIEDAKTLGTSQFPFLPQAKHLFYDLLAQKVINSSQLTIEQIDQSSLPQTFSARYERGSKQNRYATIDIASMFKSQRNCPNGKTINFSKDLQSHSKGFDFNATNFHSKSKNKKRGKLDQRSLSGSSKYSESGKVKKHDNPHRLEKIGKNLSYGRQTHSSINNKYEKPMQNCFTKFAYKERAAQDMHKSLNTTNLGLLTSRNHFQQLERLKMTLYNCKLEEKEKLLQKQGLLQEKVRLEAIQPKQKRKNFVEMRRQSRISSKVERKIQEICKQTNRSEEYGNKCEPWDGQGGDSNFWQNYY